MAGFVRAGWLMVEGRGEALRANTGLVVLGGVVCEDTMLRRGPVVRDEKNGQAKS